MAGDAAQELERFRRQWREEVQLRSRRLSSASASKTATTEPKTGRPGPSRAPPAPQGTRKESRDAHENWEYGYHDLEDKDETLKLGDSGSGSQIITRKEPSSALEHYERAVERETEGSLGDSLSHYRKAYRLDAGVDNAYKKKHFPNPPPAIPKPISTNPSNAPVTVPNPAHHSLADARGPISELVASFATLSIPSEKPPTDASRAPPCPITTMPSEILTQILLQTAISDPASFARLSLVCKRLAYLVATEDRIWRRICIGYEFGFGAMHYAWACSITGHPLPISIDEFDAHLSSLTLVPDSATLPLTLTYPSYKMMYHIRPRLRFTGCYISTVNYIRPGAATASQATWNSPVLIVTYYRYLRFFKDGTCISLLTTAEPAEVVHHLTKENLSSKNHAGGLPSAVMNHALRGRWRLSGDPWGVEITQRAQSPNVRNEGGVSKHAEAEGIADIGGEEGILHIETEGADAGAKNPKYVYKMMLQLQNAGGGKPGKTRNNRMGWLGYWSYNKLSDDWAEFGLKNDKPFYWSRVKSYGSGW